jgi:TPR repeat protein
VARDEEKAISWFQKAAELGDQNAANSLGLILENRKDYAGAIKWYQKAADSGLPIAEFHVGEMYDLGRGVPQDFGKAIEWYTKAAEQADSGSLCNIGILYYNGEGVKLDREKAYTYILLAFRGGDSRAFELLNFTAEKLDKKQIARASDEAQAWLKGHRFKSAGEEFSAPEPIMSADAKLVTASQVRAAGLD